MYNFADSDSEPEDNVHLWEQGWKERYYNNKFGVPSDDDEFICSLAEQYTRGLCWVLGYYYQVHVCTCMCTCVGGIQWTMYVHVELSYR